MALILNKISAFCGPSQLGAPDDLLNVISTFINEAEDSLEIAVQEIDHPDIALVIIDAKRRGVKIRIVLEQSYMLPSQNADPSSIDITQPNPGDSHEINRQLLSQMLRAGISLHVDFNEKIFHQKFIIRDGNKVLTGSTNFTITGVTKNFNHIIIINNHHIAKQYQAEFDEIMAGRFGKNSNYDFKEPKIYDSGNVPVTVLFAPDHAPEMVIMKQMLKAKESIKFAIFTFSQSSGIDDTMKVLAKSGISIKGVMDRSQSNQSWAAKHNLTNIENIQLWQAGRFNNPTIGKLHHKLMVIDDKVVIAGSFNYTGPANYINDENIIQIGSDSQPKNFDDNEWAEALQNQANIAKYFSDEIDRIIEDDDTVLVV